MNLAPDALQQYCDNSGNPLAGGTIDAYVAGTTTRQNTYTDSLGGTANANPVVLDSAGRASMWLDPTLSYKLVYKDSSGNTIKTVDNLAGSAASGLPTWSANTTYSIGNIVSDGTGIIYASLTNSNLNNALTSVANWRIVGGAGAGRSTVTANTALSTSDHNMIVRSNSTSALTHTLPACSTSPIGLTITVKDIGSGGFTTSVKGSGSDTIDGNVTYATALAQYDFLRVRNNGTSWDTV